jgi:hypothetical protein
MTYSCSCGGQLSAFGPPLPLHPPLLGLRAGPDTMMPLDHPRSVAGQGLCYWWQICCLKLQAGYAFKFNKSLGQLYNIIIVPINALHAICQSGRHYHRICAHLRTACTPALISAIISACFFCLPNLSNRSPSHAAGALWASPRSEERAIALVGAGLEGHATPPAV